MGTKYFVDLFNTNSGSYFPYFMPWSLNKNASNILKYSKGVSLISLKKNYSIYLNQYYSGSIDEDLPSLMLLGGYSSLLGLANFGINLTKFNIFLSTDYSMAEINFIAQSMGQIIMEGNNSLYDLVFPYFNITDISPLKYLGYGNGYGWENSEQYFGSVIFSGGYPNSYAFSSGAGKLVIPIYEQSSGKRDVWLRVVSNNFSGGLMNVTLNGNQQYQIDTKTISNTTFGNGYWVRFPFNLTKGANFLNITSFSGNNGIIDIRVSNAGIISQDLIKLKKVFKDLGVRIVKLNLSVLDNLKSISEFTVPNKTVNLNYTISGLSFNQLSSKYLLARIPYFQTFQVVNNAKLLPSFGSLSFVVYNISSKKLNVYVDSYAPYMELLSFVITYSILYPVAIEVLKRRHGN